MLEKDGVHISPTHPLCLDLLFFNLLSINTHNCLSLCRCYVCDSSAPNLRLFYRQTHCTFLSESAKCLKCKFLHLHWNLNAFLCFLLTISTKLSWENQKTSWSKTSQILGVVRNWFSVLTNQTVPVKHNVHSSTCVLYLCMDTQHESGINASSASTSY